MSVKIKVREGESIESALYRFGIEVQREYGRRWCKRRFGYYEKPSALRRKQKKMAWLGYDHLWLHIGLKELFSRTGPTNAAGR
ncbi:30S ribosomal protein S21 [Candidatus Poribacteria bacterium]|nr:30S ribosomal protein S21 [Candidatus Poribacteria bacterium]